MEVVTLPKLGISDEGELVAWEVEIGDTVEEGDLLAVFESDKASAEVTATAGGVLLATYLDEGDVIDVDPGRPIAVVGESGETPPQYEDLLADEDARASATAGGTPGAGATQVAEESGGGGESGGVGDTDDGNDGGSSGITATPRAKRYAREVDVDLAAVEGTGPQGAVTEDDVVAYEELADTDPAGLTVTESRTLSGTRRTIAERLSRSAREKPHVMGTRQVSIERLETFHDRLEEAGPSLNDLILVAVARTLADYPAFNARYEDETHRLVEEVNVGYAVDTPKGLVVPVLRNLSGKDPAAVHEERRERVERVRADEHTAEDLQGGTFTVTNVGSLGVDVSHSIIDPPQVAILAIGRRKPAAFERDGTFVLERAITFSLTIDHRVLDGADTGRFLARLDDYLQEPDRLVE
ncbi:dihydrolipoamide acetyltransferase family protein [Haloglomus litoreum]|uniref:dihydrolipoamide acetyltransferase family protein n=1 Tax=Haloglomus litoreum TaxID=3034026 RepID=UPI0023E7964B|nr:dihydrolipoamide acetyltransferase family protein [Haloglomus sp. DT116]